jgi:tetratricopeptide (TPR) repeat protein
MVVVGYRHSFLASILADTRPVLGSEISVRADYVGQYAHSSLQPVANYVPRPRLQQKIREQLHNTREDERKETQTLVVYGLGGSGKSQLVLNYIRECRRDYTVVFWIEAGQKESIERDYIQIYQLLFGHTATKAELIKLEDAVPAVKNWFHQQRGRSLVVLDSADTIDNEDDISYVDLEYFLPDASSVDNIITTRSSRAQEMSILETVEVAEMEADEATALFRKCARLNHELKDAAEEILKIVKELGYLALAVTLAGSYVATRPRLSSDLRQYLPEYRERRKQLLDLRATKHVHRYGESVLSTWETSFSAVARQSPVASRLLSLLAFFNFDDIFFDPFISRTNPDNNLNVQSEDKVKANNQRWRSFVSPEACLDQYEIESAFAVLQTFSLVQWRHDQAAYTMHKLVHAWGRDRLEIDQQRELSLAALELLTGVVPACRGNLVYGTRLVPHVMANFDAVSTAYRSPNRLDDIALRVMPVVCNFLRGLGRLSDEYQVQSFHFRKTSEVAGTEHPDTLMSMNNVARVLSDQGKYKAAEEMHRQVLGLMETVLGKEHPSTLISMNNLATVLNRQGKYEAAEEMHRQTLRLTETVLGKEHPDTLASMSNLAEVLTNQGKYEAAEEMNRQILKLRKTVLGKEHPDTRKSMNNLAEVLNRQGRYETTEEMHRQILKLRETVLGKEHPSTLASMNNLARVLNRQGKYEAAEEIHSRTLRLIETVLGKEHPSTLTSMNNLARALSNQGRYEAAEEMHYQTLKLRETVLGKEHPSTLTSMNNLARMLNRQGKYKTAEEMHRQTLKLRETVLGKEHPSTLTSMKNLARMLNRQGKYEMAEEMHRQILKLRETVLGKEHPSTLKSMNNLARVLKNQGKYEAAEEMHRQVLGLRETITSKSEFSK